MSRAVKNSGNLDSAVSIFMCGDVMTGRGIDQILPFPSNPVIHEPYLKNAREYVRLAENKNGLIAKPVDFSYIWGDSLHHLDQMAPDVRIINLETSVTKSDDYWRGKEIHYRMKPENIPCLKAARIDCCALANNHVLDWGYSGLTETLKTLAEANLKTSGAGENIEEAEAPAVLNVKGKGRVIVFSLGSETSGIPLSWAAAEDRAGVNLLGDFSENTFGEVKRRVESVKSRGDIMVVSIHWGANWGYNVAFEQRTFARRLVSEAGVDVVHGHSSHHFKEIEVYGNKLILYGCGDFLNDYEGIGGYEVFRSDLCLMYFANVEAATGNLLSLDMKPMQISHFRVNDASREDAVWMKEALDRLGRKLGVSVELKKDNTLSLAWN